MREKQGPHDSRISQLRAKIVAKRVASQIKGQRDSYGRLPVVDGGDDADLQTTNPELWWLVRDPFLDHRIILGNGNLRSIEASEPDLPEESEVLWCQEKRGRPLRKKSSTS